MPVSVRVIDARPWPHEGRDHLPDAQHECASFHVDQFPLNKRQLRPHLEQDAPRPDSGPPTWLLSTKAIAG